MEYLPGRLAFTGILGESAKNREQMSFLEDSYVKTKTKTTDLGQGDSLAGKGTYLPSRLPM